MGFIIAGLVALAVGAYVMNLSNGGEAEEEVGGLQPAADESAQPAPTQEPEAVPVEVRIHTDVQEATLLVNGEAHGRLPTDGPREMKLRPGAYRFEAQSGGVEAAVAVVTVRPDIPLDVYLSLPPGQAGAGGAAEGDDTPEPDEAPGDEQDPAQQAAPEQAPAAAAKPGADAAAAAAEERRRKRREERAARKAAATPKPKPAVKVKVKPKVVAPPPKPVAPPPPKQPGIPDNPF
jgi:hypothetical protein